VASLPCLICPRAACQARHLPFAQRRALGSKVSDEWTVPLCFTHRRALHDTGNEELWWQVHAVDAKAEAERLWRITHGVDRDGADIVSSQATIPSNGTATGTEEAQSTGVSQKKSAAE
jgi:hypothetical protein